MWLQMKFFRAHHAAGGEFPAFSDHDGTEGRVGNPTLRPHGMAAAKGIAIEKNIIGDHACIKRKVQMRGESATTKPLARHRRRFIFRVQWHFVRRTVVAAGANRRGAKIVGDIAAETDGE